MQNINGFSTDLSIWTFRGQAHRSSEADRAFLWSLQECDALRTMTASGGECRIGQAPLGAAWEHSELAALLFARERPAVQRCFELKDANADITTSSAFSRTSRRMFRAGGHCHAKHSSVTIGNCACCACCALQAGLPGRSLIPLRTLRSGRTLLAFRSYRSCNALLAFRSGDSGGTREPLIAFSSLLKKPSPWRECRDLVFCHESAEAGMRDTFVDQGGLFSYIAPDARVPANHPLRKIRELVRDVLDELTRSLGRLYASEGPLSIPPEQLLSALLLQVFYGIRSERQFMEQLDYNLSDGRVPVNYTLRANSRLWFCQQGLYSCCDRTNPNAERRARPWDSRLPACSASAICWEATRAAKPNTPRAHGGGRAD